jgi:DNA polymerase-3 subunit beta
MSNEESRHNLNGIYLHKEDDKLKAASTDGHRLSVSEISVETKENIQGVIISKKTVFEVKRIFDSFSEDVSISFSANQVQFSTGDVVFISKLVDGMFPEYKRVIPETTGDFFIVNRQNFIEVIDRVAIISDDKIRSIKLELSKNNLACHVVNNKIGNGRDEMEIMYAGKDWSAGFNANYLLDIAQTLQGERLKIYVKESLSPILIIDETEPESLFVVMPMRI